MGRGLVGPTAQPDFSVIKPLIDAHFWTWSRFALEANLSMATILSLRAGRRRASFTTICRMADALGVDPREIVKKEG